MKFRREDVSTKMTGEVEIHFLEPVVVLRPESRRSVRLRVSTPREVVPCVTSKAI